MFILNRIISLASPIFIWLIWMLSPSQPNLILLSGLSILIIFFISFWQLFNRQFSKEFWRFFGLPFLFFLASFSFSFFLMDKGPIKQIFVLFIAFLSYLIMEDIFNFLYRPHIYQTNSLETLYSNLNLLTVFFLSAVFYNLIFFLDIQPWIIIAIFPILIIFLGFYFFWVNKIFNKENVSYVLIISLVLTEFFWAISFSPANFYVNSLILVLIYYLMIMLSKYHILRILNKKIIRQYLIIVIIAFLLVILTARWR